VDFIVDRVEEQTAELKLLLFGQVATYHIGLIGAWAGLGSPEPGAGIHKRSKTHTPKP
jgi:hypothetical protein